MREPWFVAKDVCDVLEIDGAHISEALSRLDEDERGNATVVTPGGPQEMRIVSEQGVYGLVLTKGV